MVYYTIRLLSLCPFGVLSCVAVSFLEVYCISGSPSSFLWLFSSHRSRASVGFSKLPWVLIPWAADRPDAELP